MSKTQKNLMVERNQINWRQADKLTFKLHS
jgi:hypothetical protein